MKPRYLPQFLSYIRRVYKFSNIVDKITDQRHNPQIPPSHIFLSVFLMFIMRQPSFNHFSLKLKFRSLKRLIGSKRKQVSSADTLAYSLDRFQIDPLWRGLAFINKTLKRNKVFKGSAGNLVAASLDLTELFKSRSRCCKECLQRTITLKNKEKVKEFYHAAVQAQILGTFPHSIIGSSLQRRGEDEVSCASSLIDDISKYYGKRFVDLWVLDSAYCEAPFIKKILSLNSNVLVILKDERRDLFKDAQGLFSHMPPTLSGKEDMGRTTYKIWDEDDFTSWESLDRPVRVIKVEETQRKIKILKGKPTPSVEKHSFFAACTLPKERLSSKAARRLIHRRWEIENNGHRELKTNYHIDHPFRHSPKAIIALLLILAIAFDLFYAFLYRNLKTFLTEDITARHVAEQICAEILLEETYITLWKGG